MPAKKNLKPAWHARDLYNLLMEEIEPELCTQNLQFLNDWYFHETPEQRKARFAWYADAFGMFLEKFRAFTDALHGEFQRLQHSLRAAAEENAKKGEGADPASLEHFFDEQ